MKIMGPFIAILSILILSMFAIGFSDSVAPPTNQSALNQYNNLSQAIEISSTGMYGTMLILIAVMVLGAAMFMYHSLRR